MCQNRRASIVSRQSGEANSSGVLPSKASCLRQLTGWQAWKQRPRRRVSMLHWVVKRKRNNKKQVLCSWNWLSKLYHLCRPTKELKEHLHSLKIYLSRKKKKHSLFFLYWETWKEDARNWHENSGLPSLAAGRKTMWWKVLLCVWVCLCWLGWVWLELIVLSVWQGFELCE